MWTECSKYDLQRSTRRSRVVRFGDIDEFVDHHCLEKLVRFGDIDEIVDHHCLEKLVLSADIGTIFT
jgi:inorganic pyrophosphatase/exopolyphosphatase